MFKFATLALAATVVSALPAIEIKGNAFYDTDSQERFYLRGVAYQPGGSSNLTDPLADADICSRDIPHFKDLGLNVLRVYSIDNTEDHSECMQMLNDAGIYVLLDVNLPKTSLSRGDTECSYNLDYMTEIFATVDEFSSYNNTLGFFSANELVNEEEYMYLSPYIKAVTRDIKQYLKAHNYRQIPVGYSAADVSEIRYDLAHYLNCGDDSEERIDMLGMNDYSWCGSSSFALSGYSEKVKDFSDYSIPLFLSEFGCNKVPGDRPFTEVSTIYSEQMSPVFSGGVVYQYFQDENKYGLVEINNDELTTLNDFTNLKKEFAETSNPTGDGGANSYSISECPTSFNFSSTVPAQPAGLTDLIKKGADGNNIGFFATTQEACESKEEDDEDSSDSSSSSSTTTSIMSSSTLSSSTVSSSIVSPSTVSTITTNSHKNEAIQKQNSVLVQCLLFLVSLLNI